jgi:hypothetical protein
MVERSAFTGKKVSSDKSLFYGAIETYSEGWAKKPFLPSRIHGDKQHKIQNT